MIHDLFGVDLVDLQHDARISIHIQARHNHCRLMNTEWNSCCVRYTWDA